MDSYLDAYDFDACTECGECLSGCKYMGMDADEAMDGIARLRDGNGVDGILDRCVFCAQCNERCPVEARPAALLLERLRDRRKAEGTVSEFFAYYSNGMERLGWTENYFKDVYLASDEATRKIVDGWSEPKQGDDILWCGCGNRVNPHGIEHSRVLAGLPKYGAVADCCGSNPAKMGLYDAARMMTEDLIEALSRSTFKRLVVSCGSCQKHFRIYWPTYFGEKFPFEVISLYEYIVEQLDAGKFAVQRKVDLDAALSDACYGHAFGEDYLGAVRRLCAETGIKVTPLEHHGGETACCGVSGYARRMELEGVRDAMRLKAQDIKKSGKQDVLNYCMGCHTMTTIVHPCKSHYLLDKVLWALGDDAPSSLFVPKSVTRKATAKLMSTGRAPLPMA